MKTWTIALLMVCALSAAACNSELSPQQAVPRASGAPSPTELQAIQTAATRLASEREAKLCTSPAHCSRTTVFIDDKPVGDGLLTQVAQGLLLHDLGGTATASSYTALMQDERSAFFRRALAATAYNGLLLLDAGTALTAEQRRTVDERVRGAQQAITDGTVRVGTTGRPHSVSPDEMQGYEQTLRSSIQAQVLASALATAPDAEAEVRSFIKAALRRHRVEFTPAAGVDAADVLAYADEAAGA